MRRIYTTAWSAALAACLAAPACGPTGSTSDDGNNNFGGSDAHVLPTDAGTIAPVDADPQYCAEDHYTAEPVPLDIVMMLDQSGSMGVDAVGGGTLWSHVTTAVTDFVQAPETAGIGIGIQYFPLIDDTLCVPCASDCGVCVDGCCAVPGADPCGPTCASGVCINNYCAQLPAPLCDATAYATPDVPIGVLPGVAQAIVASLASHAPDNGTPMGAALAGAIDYATDWAAAHPTHNVVVVLASDGDPTVCMPNAVSDIAAMAAAAAAATPPIRTFVIGVGDDLTDLHAIAAAGNTNSAYLVDTNNNAGVQFLDAMQIIRDGALACQFLIPTPDQGLPDLDLLNVQFTPTGGTPITIPMVPDLAACGTADGWYYDDPTDPDSIVLCPETCTESQGDPNAEMAILLGCETIVL